MICLHLLGRIDLRGADGRELRNVLAQPKRLALLAYLADGPQRRDALVAIFWPDLDHRHARNALSKTVHFLRRSLGHGAFVSRSDEELALDRSVVWSDVDAFGAALDEGRWAEALELYRGELLPAFFVHRAPAFEQWLERERFRLRSRAVEAARALIDTYEHQGDPALAAHYARHALDLCGADEGVCQAVIQFCDRIGDRAGAIHAYEAFARRLRVEYDLEPSPETEALMAAVRERPCRQTIREGPTIQPPPLATPPELGTRIEPVHLVHPQSASAGRVSFDATSAIKRALATTPADRYAAASHFAQALSLAQPAAARSWRRTAMTVAIAAALVVAGLGMYRTLHLRAPASGKGSRDVPRLAVLPFENLGAPEDDYFADGITDEIMTKLAGLSGLAVISPQSAMQFKGTEDTPAQIGKKLGVQYLLQGMIRWQSVPDGPSRVRVTPRLIRLADDRHVWAADFDEVLEDVFQLQGQIATHVAEALGLALLHKEQEALTEHPTQNLEAYDFYLRGNAHFQAGFPVRPRLRDAVEIYQKAVELDPGFARAVARLSLAQGGVRWGDLDPGRSDEHLSQQREHAERALALDAALAEAHVAMGFYHYWGHRDYKTALQEFEIALAAEPNNSFVMSAKATILKRTGDFAASAALNARAADLDPLSWSPAIEAWIGYDLAARYIDRYASLQPGSWVSAYTRLRRDGNVTALRQWLTSVDEAGMIQLLAQAAHGGSFPMQSHALVRILCGVCDAAIPLVPRNRERDSQRYVAIALLHERAGRPGEARMYYDSARVRLEGLQRLEGPDQSPDHLGVVYAKLDRRGDAVRAANANLENARHVRDVLAETNAIQVLATVYIVVGEYDAALNQLAWLMSHPSWLSAGLLKADPLYDPLRSHPSFQALLAKYDR